MVTLCNATKSQKADYKVKLDYLLGKTEIPRSASYCKSVNYKKHIVLLQLLIVAQAVLVINEVKKCISGCSVYVEKI